MIGSERHESRRIDNQLRGRSGRQGDAGSTRFYLSLQDDLMRIFASDKVGSLMKKLGMEEGEAIEHPWVNRAIENAQRKVEGSNYDIRKQLLEYDNVANDQRKVVYKQRNEVMAETDLSETITVIREDIINNIITTSIPPGSLDEQWDIDGLESALKEEFGQDLPMHDWLEQDNLLGEAGLRRKILSNILDEYHIKEETVGAEVLRNYEKQVFLNVLDRLWKEHLAAMDYLRQSIGLRGYAQKDPKQEYKREAFEMFGELLERMKYEVVSILSKVKVQANDAVDQYDASASQQVQNVSYQHASAEGMANKPVDEEPQEAKASAEPFERSGKKIGRNEPCHCGSGKKYKQCHGKLT